MEEDGLKDSFQTRGREALGKDGFLEKKDGRKL